MKKSRTGASALAAAVLAFAVLVAPAYAADGLVAGQAAGEGQALAQRVASAVGAREAAIGIGAQATVWEGEGTQESPYLIGTADDLAKLAERVNSGIESERKHYFKQTGDIDLSDIANWTPIGNESMVFSGYYDGDGHSVAGMNVSGTNYLGLFGHIAEAEIRNLVVSGAIEVLDGTGLTGYRNVGGIVGRSGRTRAEDSNPKTAVIANCASAVDITSKKTGNGGICGQATTDTSIENCLYSGTIALTCSSNFATGGATGGILGYANSSDTIAGCVNRGKIYNAGAGDTSIGGIMGEAYVSNDVRIENCYNLGDLSTTGTSASVGVGGIVGKRTNWFDSNSTSDKVDVYVSNCYNAGAVSAPNKDGKYAGGIFGNVIKDSFGNLVVSDENTSAVYSLYKKAPRIIYNSTTDAEAAGALAKAGAFRATADEDEGIPWLLSQLGDGFKADANYVNDGFPLLAWQEAGDALAGDNGRVAFSVAYDTDANLAVGVDPSIEVDGEPIEGASAVLPAGSHSYRVSLRGYETAEGTVDVAADLENVQAVAVKLIATRYAFTVTVTPETAALVVADEAGDAVEPTSAAGGTYVYQLVNGAYAASASAEGFYDAGESFTVDYAEGALELACPVIPETAPQEPAKDDEGFYLITKPQELAWVDYQATRVSTEAAVNMSHADIRLAADIDMVGYEWYPMFGRELARQVYPGYYSGGCYSGTFDGAGHVIRNLAVERTNASTLYVSNRVDAVGALFGFTKQATIKDVGVTGTVKLVDTPEGSTGDYTQVGGLVGMAQSDTHITGCYADIDVEAQVTGSYADFDDLYVGGIAGSLTTGSVVEDCYSAGSLVGRGAGYVFMGGIAGSTRGDYHVYDDATNELIYEQQNRIARSYTTCDVTADATYSGYIGGIVGMVRAAAVGKIPEIYYDFALNGTLDGTSTAKVGANRILGNGAAFDNQGHYNYALDSMAVVRATIDEEGEHYANGHGRDITAAAARQAAAYEELGWAAGIWNLAVLDSYPRLAWEDVAGHVHDYEEVVVPPTCTDYGYTVYTCKVCGEQVIGAFTNPGAHQYGAWTVSAEHAGAHEHACELCGEVEVAPHTWDAGKVTVAPTATSTGVKTFTCVDCGATRTEPIAKLTAAEAAAARPVAPLSVAAKSLKAKASKLKKKAVSFKAAKAFKVSGAAGKVAYKKLSGSKKVTVTAAGKVKVKKKAKKGTYKVRVLVSCAGDSRYKPASRTATLKVKVK